MSDKDTSSVASLITHHEGSIGLPFYMRPGIFKPPVTWPIRLVTSS
jgi:hypothetical protein